ncbi:hypothetical protein E2C01_059155 [Portunus trituberculatus]|uniref:Uncharacterized protein n=1 Tax=Portunus trituberculatus TaxID=210409 RepID=A0A5B7GXB4_PORTR|nr:hypothetical protein [Portunus trituberculatus]
MDRNERRRENSHHHQHHIITPTTPPPQSHHHHSLGVISAPLPGHLHHGGLQREGIRLGAPVVPADHGRPHSGVWPVDHAAGLRDAGRGDRRVAVGTCLGQGYEKLRALLRVGVRVPGVRGLEGGRGLEGVLGLDRGRGLLLPREDATAVSGNHLASSSSGEVGGRWKLLLFLRLEGDVLLVPWDCDLLMHFGDQGGERRSLKLNTLLSTLRAGLRGLDWLEGGSLLVAA